MTNRIKFLTPLFVTSWLLLSACSSATPVPTAPAAPASTNTAEALPTTAPTAAATSAPLPTSTVQSTTTPVPTLTAEPSATVQLSATPKPTLTPTPQLQPVFTNIFAWPGWKHTGGNVEVSSDGSTVELLGPKNSNELTIFDNNMPSSWLIPKKDFVIEFGMMVGDPSAVKPNTFYTLFQIRSAPKPPDLLKSKNITLEITKPGQLDVTMNNPEIGKYYPLGSFELSSPMRVQMQFSGDFTKPESTQYLTVINAETGKTLFVQKLPWSLFDENSRLSFSMTVDSGMKSLQVQDFRILAADTQNILQAK